jgi:putative acetyltransferase
MRALSQNPDFQPKIAVASIVSYGRRLALNRPSIFLQNGSMSSQRPPVVIRGMRSKDARAFLEVHHAAVRGIAVKDYPLAVIEAWAPMPVTEDAIEWVRANPHKEFRLIAEIAGRVVGIGTAVFENIELRACYVAPEVGRKGVGSALVKEIERVAPELGVPRLELDSSVTAESFYRTVGYEVVERGEHVLRNGKRMACVKMRKELGV